MSSQHFVVVLKSVEKAKKKFMSSINVLLALTLLRRAATSEHAGMGEESLTPKAILLLFVSSLRYSDHWPTSARLVVLAVKYIVPFCVA